jgi:hypothetical protein
MQKQSPIFSRTYDLLLWLIPVTVRFPRQQRFVLAAAIQQAALRFQEEIVEAVHVQPARPVLDRADAALASLRLHLRLAHDLGLLTAGQYQHGAGMVNEIGKLLGGWLKSV